MQKHPRRKTNREVAFFEQLEQRLLLSTIDYDLVINGTGFGEKGSDLVIADGETLLEIEIWANVPDVDFGGGVYGGLLQSNYDLVDSSGVLGRIDAVQGVGGPPSFAVTGFWASTSEGGLTTYQGAVNIDGTDVLGQSDAFAPSAYNANYNAIGAGPDVWTLICTGNFNILVTQGDVVTLSLVPSDLNGQLVYGLTGVAEHPTEAIGDSITLTLGTAGPAPEIVVEDGSETEVYDGETTPIDIGSADRGAAGPSMEFTIRNIGTTEILNLTAPFADLPHFIVSDPLETALDPGEETTFTVTLITTETGTFPEKLEFGNNDPDENPFDFFVTGTVNAIPQEITVLDGGDADVSDGTPGVDAVYIGFAEKNETGPDMIFTIRNDGDFDLTLVTPFEGPGLTHFTVTDPGATTLLAGETTTFTVTLLTTETGTFTEEVSFGNNDTDENPFNFYVTGLVGLPTPEITVLDGSDDNVADNGLEPDAIDIGSVQNSAAGPEMTFTIRNDGTAELTLDAVFSDLPHFTVGDPGVISLLAGEETTFTVTLITTETGLWTEEISFGNNDDNENPFNFHVIGAVLAAAPEIVVLDDGAGDIADGETTPFDIGSAEHFAGGPSRTFTIRNDGQQALTLSTPFVDLPHFIVSEPGTASLGASETTTFTVTLLTGENGTWTEVVSFGNNDDDENPFNFTVTGTVIPLPAEIVVLDGENDDVSDGEVFPLYIGNAQLGWTGPDMTFTIRNDGEQNLDLTTPFADAAHFEVSDPGVTTLTAGQQTTFTVTLLTHEEGDFIEVISFANNDGDENPFSFTVSGWVSLLVQFIPFSEEFSGDEPDGWTGWEYYSSNSNGRIEVADGELRMYDAAEHPAGLGPLNEAILHLNLIGESGVWVALDQSSAYDEDHALPSSFIGHQNGDGVSFSADGTTWYLLTDLTDSFTGRWYDLDAAVQSAGIAYSSDFRIKFQQFDNQPWGDDGRAFDNIRVQTVGTGDATVQYEIRVNGSADPVIIEEPGPFTVEVYANVPNAEVTSGVYGGLLHSSYSLEDSSGIIGLADPVTASPTWNSTSYNGMANNSGLVNTGGYDVLGQEDYFTSAQWGDNWDTVGAGPGVWTLISSGTFDPVVYEDDTITLTVVPGDAGDMVVYGPNSPEYALSALGDSIDVTLAGRIFDFGGKIKAQFYDGDGDLVTISLSGPGDGRLYLNGGKIVLDGTSGKSTLSIKVRKLGVGDGRFAIGNIFVGDDNMLNGVDSLKAISAKTTDLLGDIIIEGTLIKLVFGNVDSDHNIVIGQPGNGKEAVSMTFGSVIGLSVDSAMPIKSITASEWLGSGDVISAPSIGKIKIKDGNLEVGIESQGIIKSIDVKGGDVTGDIVATQLGKLSIKGGDLAASLDIDEYVGKIYVKSARNSDGDYVGGDITEDASITVNGADSKGNSIKSISTKGSDFAGTIETAAHIGKLDFSGDMLGVIEALSVGTFKVKGDASGELTVTRDTTPNAKGKVPDALKKFTVKGWMTDFMLFSSGHIGSITVGGIEDSDIYAGVNPGVSGLPFPGSDLDAGAQARIKSLIVKGMKDGAKQPVDSVINSNIAAWEFQKIQASYIQTDNGDSPFGIVSTFIKKLIYKEADFKGTWSNLSSPADVLEALDGADLDDYQIRLV